MAALRHPTRSPGRRKKGGWRVEGGGELRRVTSDRLHGMHLLSRGALAAVVEESKYALHR